MHTQTRNWSYKHKFNNEDVLVMLSTNLLVLEYVLKGVIISIQSTLILNNLALYYVSRAVQSGASVQNVAL